MAVVPSASTTSSGVNMIDGLAVPERASTRRIVADHPADRGPIAGRDVRAEHQTQWLQVRIELVEYDARLDAHRHRVTVHDANPIQVFGKIDDDRRADRLAGEAGGCPPRNDRHVLFRGDRHGRDDVLGGPGHDDAQRLDLVETGVGRVQATRPGSKWTSARDSRLSRSDSRRRTEEEGLVVVVGMEVIRRLE